MTIPDLPGTRVKVLGDLFHGQVPPGAVYLGRSAPGLAGSPLANPHRAGRPCRVCHGVTHTSVEAVIAYAEHLEQRPDLVDLIRKEYTAASVFCCWCAPEQPCHVDVVRALLTGQEPGAVAFGLHLAAAFIDGAADGNLPAPGHPIIVTRPRPGRA